MDPGRPRAGTAAGPGATAIQGHVEGVTWIRGAAAAADPAADWRRSQGVLDRIRAILVLPTATMFSPPDWAKVLAGRCLDVRNADERAEGAIDGSLHIPLAELPGRLSEVPPAPRS